MIIRTRERRPRRIVFFGNVPNVERLKGGNFVKATVLDNCFPVEGLCCHGGFCPGLDLGGFCDCPRYLFSGEGKGFGPGGLCPVH